MSRLEQVLFYSVIALTIILSSGCASITGTTGQNISVETRSSDGKGVTGASCELSNSKGKWFVTTPGSVGIHRSNDNMTVICKKDGFDAGTASVVSDTKASMFGNIIFGGGIGAIIDHNSGSAYEYPTLIQIIMGSAITIETKPPEEGAENPNSSTQANKTTKTESMPSQLAPSSSESKTDPPSNQSASFKKLKELDALRKEGLITQEEFESKKAEILKGM